MTTRFRLTSVNTVLDEEAWVFTARHRRGEDIEVLLVPCTDDQHEAPVVAWVNRCTHENQRLYRDDSGAIIRDGGIVCPKHGSVFNTCSGGCRNGPATGSTLPAVDITIDNGQVYLTDEALTFLHAGPNPDDDDDDDEPRSTSHLQF